MHSRKMYDITAGWKLSWLYKLCFHSDLTLGTLTVLFTAALIPGGNQWISKYD